MAGSEVTCWALVRGAARGAQEDREAFARRYVPVVRSYLAARWRGTPLIQEIDDALQEVFVDCFKHGGALQRADSSRPFRAFFYGVIRIVALRHEDFRKRRRREEQPQSAFDVEADDPALSRVFDAAWAQSIMEQAGACMEARARDSGDGASRRLELLKLRFQEDMPIREIARLWGTDAARLHHEYAKARGEFREALVAVVACHHPASRADLEAEAARLLGLFE